MPRKERLETSGFFTRAKRVRGESHWDLRHFPPQEHFGIAIFCLLLWEEYRGFWRTYNSGPELCQVSENWLWFNRSLREWSFGERTGTQDGRDDGCVRATAPVRSVGDRKWKAHWKDSEYGPKKFAEACLWILHWTKAKGLWKARVWPMLQKGFSSNRVKKGTAGCGSSEWAALTTLYYCQQRAYVTLYYGY